MNTNAPEQMEPIFHFLDGLISEYGLYVYLVMVWAAPFVIVWILRGGLRRKPPPAPVKVIPIVIIREPAPPPLPPPLIRNRLDRPPNTDEDSFAA